MQYSLDKTVLFDCAKKLVGNTIVDGKYLNKHLMTMDIFFELCKFNVPVNLDLTMTSALDDSCSALSERIYVILSGARKQHLVEVLNQLNMDHATRKHSRFLKCYTETLGLIMKTFWIMFLAQ